MSDKKQLLLYTVAMPALATCLSFGMVKIWLAGGGRPGGGTLANAAVAGQTADVPGPPAASHPEFRIPLALPPNANASSLSSLASAQTHTKTIELGRGMPFTKALQQLGLDRHERQALIDRLRPLAAANRFKANTILIATYHSSTDHLPEQIEIDRAKNEALTCRRTKDGQWLINMEDRPIEHRIASYRGTVRSTLWQSAKDAGMEIHLLEKLAAVFAWQLDFNREIQEDDRWRLTVERLFSRGQPIGYGDIIAAQIEQGGRVLTAVRYVEADGGVHYFDPNGTSVERRFLSSPLAYGRVTSGFTTARWHPILKIAKPHLGIDYGAPVGTPVMAIGDGTVAFSGRHGSSGIMVDLRHDGKRQTKYKHLSALAKGIRPGMRVSLGQIIGFVGATGLATGPHLHFELQVAGHIVDPKQLQNDTGVAMPTAQLPTYRRAAAKALALLPRWNGEAATEVASARSRPLSLAE